MEKISIIVPIYNVEKYLVDCIESLINQTYENLEIILVNDGSTDNCPNICNEYAKKDKRIKVIHKKNGGLSDARNCGIRVSTGKYIAFVDSDDYVEKKLYETAINKLKNEKAQIYICGRFYLYNNRKEIHHNQNVNIIMNNVEALDKMNTFGYYDVAAWDKVYEKKLFENIEYPIGKLSEDWYTTYKLIDRAQKIIYDSTPLYVYRQRANSITHSDNIRINEEPIYASKEVLDYITMKYPEISLNAKTKYVYASIGVYNNYLTYKKNSKDERKKILDSIREIYKDIISNQDLTLSRKWQLILLVKFNFLYNMIIKIYKYRKDLKVKFKK